MLKNLLALWLLILSACSVPQIEAPHEKISSDWSGDPVSMDEARYRMVTGTRGMVVSDDRNASEWGAEILRRGGNAIDAAVATAFALSVSRSHYASIGGGGFLVFCPAPVSGSKQNCKTIDYREVAPRAATRDMFLRGGKPEWKLSRVGALASGVPGVVDGLLLALEKFGTMSRQRVMSRPIEWAEHGVRLSSYGETAAIERWTDMNDGAMKIFGCAPKGFEQMKLAVCPVGTQLVQRDLGRVLREVSKSGRDGFYKGWVASRLVAGIREAGGIFTREDLESYHAKLREPLIGNYLDYEVVSMPPPSSGGVVLLELLGFAERAGASGWLDRGPGSVASIHALTHAMRLGYADRAERLGDPDFVKVSPEALISPAYLSERWKTFDPKSARGGIVAGSESGHEGTNTTHFSVIDRFGNTVAVTTTINQYFGSGFVPPGTGILMNNEMDDFSAQPGNPNFFGLIAGEKNSIVPGKRPLSSMSPTIVRDRLGQPRFVLGALGGPRIISAVFLALVNRLQYGMAISDAVIAPRFHHQWSPDKLSLENLSFPAEVRDGLVKLGYTLAPLKASGQISAIERFPNGRVAGVPDPRTEGAAVAE